MKAGRLRDIALGCGAGAAGIVPAGDLAELDRFCGAVKDVPPGLSYLARDPSGRKNINSWSPGARSALVCAFPYWDKDKDYAVELRKAGEPESWLRSTGRKVRQPELLSLPGAKISRYALSADYHVTVKGKLSRMLEAVKLEFPEVEGRIFCDTSPVMEKELGRLAGLGFRGRNTLLISEELGSWFFIGGIALNLEAEPSLPCAGSCGSCDACERACPTGALKGGVLDPALCLSYWTTQAKENIPAGIAAKAGGRAYGCDICQEVCPFNR